MGDDRVEALFREYAHRVLAYSLRRVDRSSAEDVVAEVFATAWRRNEQIPDDDALPWLYGVARRVIANQRRALRRRAAFEAKLRPLIVEQGPASGDARLADAMRALSRADREILCLAAWEGLEAPRIAIVLHCSTGAAYTRLHRAKRRLAARLDAAAETVPEPSQEAVLP